MRNINIFFSGFSNLNRSLYTAAHVQAQQFSSEKPVQESQWPRTLKIINFSSRPKDSGLEYCIYAECKWEVFTFFVDLYNIFKSFPSLVIKTGKSTVITAWTYFHLLS